MINKSRFFTKDDARTDFFKFDLPETWWSRKYEYEWVKSFVDKNDVVLDAAGGVFHPLKYYLADICKEVYSCDLDRDIEKTNLDEIDEKILTGYSLNREQLKGINKPSYFEKIKNKCCSITKLPYEDNKFNKIYCISVLEHVRNKDLFDAMNEFKRVLKDDGEIILTFDYPDISLEYFKEVLDMLHMEFVSDVDFTLPKDAIYSDSYKIYCFRAVVRKIKCPKKLKELLSKNTIPKIIHYCWFGPAPKTDLAIKCIESWKKYLPDYTIWEWNDYDLIACENRYALEAYSSKKWAFITDYYRLFALYNYGGIYFDSDNEVFKSFDDFLDLDFFSGYENWTGQISPFTAVVGSKKNNEIVKDLLSEYDNISFLQDGRPNLYTNTARVTDYFKREFGLEPPYSGTEKFELKENSIIYPYNYFCTHEGGMTYAVHHFNGSWSPNKEIKEKDSSCKYKVSVVIPTYNSEKYIKDSIDSILKQTFQDFEIIIVDDNSTDKTLKIIKNYRDKRIKVIQGPREGLAMALNVGIDAAQGEYIARMDSDDIAISDRLEKQLGYMDTNPDIGICGSGAVFWNQETGQKDFHQNSFEDIDIRTSLFFVCPIIHPTVMFRKRMLDEHNLRYSLDGNGAEDLEFWLRAARFVKFHNLPEPLIVYRVHSSNVSITDGKNLKKFSHQLYQANYKEIFDIEIADDIIGAFRPTERLDTSYSLDQVLRIVKTSEDLIKKIKELDDKEKYNIPLFEKILLEGVQQIIQNNSANFAPLAK